MIGLKNYLLQKFGMDSNIKNRLFNVFNHINKMLMECEEVVDDRALIIIENSLMAQLHLLSIYTESFWNTLTSGKDIFSYKFNQRLFPMVENEKDDICSPPAESGTNSNFNYKLTGAGRDYDLRDSIYKTLNTDYIDEGSIGSYYKVLPMSSYYEIIGQDIIDNIFIICLKRKFYGVILYLFAILATSREHYHLVMNKTITGIIFSPIFDQSLEIIHYIMYYFMYLAYKEECIIKSQVSPKHRFLIDLDMAARFPQYYGGIATNPYLATSLSPAYIRSDSLKDDELAIKPIRISNKYRGLYTLEVFKYRFDIFTNGIFKNMSMDRIYFTGSVIPACAMKNPLELLFSSAGGSEDERLRAYFNEYYPSKEVLDKGSKENKENTKNIENMKNTKLEDVMSDIDIVVNIRDDAEYKKKVYMIFNHVKNILENRLGRQVEEHELKLYKKITPKSFKYFVSGSLLGRNLEIFRMYANHPLGSISRFHFPMVRGIYDGQRVKLFPSAVAFAMTGVCLDYKWMASNNDSKDLLLKYYFRGAYTLLNEKEHAYLVKHIENNPEIWGIIKQYGEITSRSVSLMNPIFKPRLYGHGTYKAIYNIVSREDCHKPDNYTFVEEDLNFMKTWTEDDKKSKSYEFDLGIRYQSGHIKAFRLWKVLAHCASLSYGVTIST